MEQYDPLLAQRVWQRVQQKSPAAQQPDLGPLLVMIGEKWENAGAFLTLLKSSQGTQGAICRRLFEQEQAMARCLQGICLLQGGTVQPRNISPKPQPRQTMLRHCCRRSLKAAAQLEQWCADGEFGVVYRQLLMREQEQCALLLELLGSGEQVKPSPRK